MGQMRLKGGVSKRQNSALLIFYIAMILGCHGGTTVAPHGNGEVVGNPPANQPPPIPYYNLNPNDICTTANGTQNYHWTILEKEDGTLTRLDNCTGQTQPISNSEVTFSLSSYLLQYQSGIYESRSYLTNTYIKALCTNLPGGDITELQVQAQLNNFIGNLYNRTSSNEVTLIDTFQFIDHSTQQIYQGTHFSLSINFSSTSQLPYKYPANLQIMGETAVRLLTCVVVK